MIVGGIVLARMGATRLPGKVLLPLCGRPVLDHIVQRLKQTPLDPIVVATTVNPSDDAIASAAVKWGIEVFRGDEENILKRTIGAMEEYGLEAALRLGADSPLVDPGIICHMYELFLEHGVEYISNSLDRSYPLGIDAEIMTLSLLRKLESIIKKLPTIERLSNESNVVPYLHQHLDEFNTFSMTADFDYSHLRWTLDTPQDFELINKIYESLYHEDAFFSWEKALHLIKENPDWSLINHDVQPKTGYWTITEQEKLKKRL
jgi:spore coat polysaccharide biosynthesis protein SpsF